MLFGGHRFIDNAEILQCAHAVRGATRNQTGKGPNKMKDAKDTAQATRRREQPSHRRQGTGLHDPASGCRSRGHSGRRPHVGAPKRRGAALTPHGSAIAGRRPAGLFKCPQNAGLEWFGKAARRERRERRNAG